MSDVLTGLAGEFAAAEEADWRVLAGRTLKGEPLDRLVGRSDDGIPIVPLLARATAARMPGVRPGGQRWSIVQRLDHPDWGAALDQAGEDLAGGADGLALVLAGSPAAWSGGLPAPQASDLGRLADLLTAGRGTMLRIEAASLPDVLLDWLAALPRGSLAGVTLADDPFAMAAASGRTPIAEQTLSERLRKRFTRFGESRLSGAIMVADGRFWHAAGAGEAQELAAVLAATAAFLRAGAAVDIAPAVILPRLAMMLAADSDQWLTIAKFRAARLVLGRLAELCGAKDACPAVHAETAWRSLSRRDPNVNLLRGGAAAFAAGLGGADSITLLPFTLADGTPDSFARRLARNTQTVLMAEAHLHRVRDPAAGAGALEALTDAMARRAWDLFREIEAEGGVAASLGAGRLQARNAATATARRRRLESGETVLVGTTKFLDAAAKMPPNRREQPAEGRQRDHAIAILPAHRLAGPFEGRPPLETTE